MEEDQVFSLEATKQRIPGGMQGVKEMAATLFEECAEQVNEIREALDKQDGSGVQRAAHTLKGSADIFAAQRVMAAAKHLEKLGAEGSLNEAQAAFEDLQREVSRMTDAVQAAINSASS